MTTRVCFQCGTDNPGTQSFCGSCGAALDLKEYISGQVAKELASAVRDRDVLETESAIRVFERSWGWAKLVTQVFALALGAVFTVLVTLAGWLGWKEFNLSKTVESAKQSVEGTASRSVSDIRTSAQSAIQANAVSVHTAGQLTRDLNLTATRTKAELNGQVTSFTTEVNKSKTALDAAAKLPPEIETIRGQLTKATTDLAAQQKVISSSEDFVKQVFSSHLTEWFSFNDFVQKRALVLPAKQPGANTIVLMLLANSPINGTLQLQLKVFAQPPGSYFPIKHNLIMFAWGDPADSLKLNPLTVSYFPDKGDKTLYNSLSIRDGNVYADDELLPMFASMLAAPKPPPQK